jgi:hypothetical protein
MWNFDRETRIFDGDLLLRPAEVYQRRQYCVASHRFLPRIVYRAVFIGLCAAEPPGFQQSISF